MHERYFFIFKNNGACPGSSMGCLLSCGVALSAFCGKSEYFNMSSYNKKRKEFVLSKLIAAGYEERIFEELL